MSYICYCEFAKFLPKFPILGPTKPGRLGGGGGGVDGGGRLTTGRAS